MNATRQFLYYDSRHIFVGDAQMLMGNNENVKKACFKIVRHGHVLHPILVFRMVVKMLRFLFRFPRPESERTKASAPSPT